MTTARATHPDHLISLQLLRALAAMMIVVIHAAHDMELIAARQGGSFSLELPWLSAGVDLFFVISGFVMVMASRGLYGMPGAGLRFMSRRIARIAPLYWLATAAFLVAALAMPRSLNTGVPGFADVARSLLFIPYARAGDGNIQPVLSLGWTLNYEMFFYVVFALLLALGEARRVVIGLTVAFAAIVALGLLVPAQEPAQLPAWLIAPLRFWSNPVVFEFVAGSWIGLIWLSGRRIAPATGITLVLVGLVLLTADLRGLAGSHVLAWGGPCALIVAGASLSERRGPGEQASLDRFAVTRALAALGDASYALYLFHPFVIRPLREIALSGQGGWLTQPTVYIAACVIGASGLALAVHALVEKPATGWMRKRLSFIAPHRH